MLTDRHRAIQSPEQEVDTQRYNRCVSHTTLSLSKPIWYYFDPYIKGNKSEVQITWKDTSPHLELNEAYSASKQKQQSHTLDPIPYWDTQRHRYLRLIKGAGNSIKHKEEKSKLGLHSKGRGGTCLKA